MANSGQPDDIIEISSSDGSSYTPLGSPPSTNWGGPPLMVIQRFACGITIECLDIVQKMQQLFPYIHNVQEDEISSMETTLKDFHRTCDTLASFSTFLREMRVDAHYKQGGALYIQLAFLNYVNNVWK